MDERGRMAGRYRIGVIGLGRMGRRYVAALTAHPRWELAWVCDRDTEQLSRARRQMPDLPVGTDAAAVLGQRNVDAVGVFTLADARPALIAAALDHGLHVLAEKPLAATIAEEEALLQRIEAGDRLVAVNLFNRNTWYHRAMVDFVRSGQLGQLVSIDVAHLTPDLLPTEGHQPEGAPFHDCGMHYVDLARWYADAEYGDWHAQGLRLWEWAQPWWVDVHGHFTNGAIFRIAQTFAYGQGAQTITARSHLEATGTHGVVRMQHDFQTVVVDYHGMDHTSSVQGRYEGKKLDVLAGLFAESIDRGHNVGFPTARDSVTASRIAQAMVEDAAQDAPVVGSHQQLLAALDHKTRLRQQGRAFPEAVLHPDGVSAIRPGET